MANSTIPDRFVYVWGEIQRMPEYDLKDSRRHLLEMVRQQAIQEVETALASALRLADIARSILNDSASKPDKP